MTASLASQISQLQQATEQQVPPEPLAAFGAEQAQLREAGVPDGAAGPGTPLPDGALLDATGAATTLAAARDGRPAVVVFYRGAWCPFCSVTLRAYQAALAAELEARGVALIAVSPQRPDGSLTAKEKFELTFAVLSDPGNQLARQLGILTAPTAATVAGQATLGLDLTTINADGTTGLPMPTAVVADAGGVIRWIDVRPDYTSRTEPEEILAALDRL